MTGLAVELDKAISQAVLGLRKDGYSWSEIAARLGVTRQAAVPHPCQNSPETGAIHGQSRAGPLPPDRPHAGRGVARNDLLSNRSAVAGLAPDHHGLHRRVQQDVILRCSRPDVRRPIPPLSMLGIARHPGHAHGEVTGDIAATVSRVIGLNRGQRGQVRLERGHPDAISKSGAMAGSPCDGSSRSRLASAWLRMARASASLAASMANRTDSAQRASRSAGVIVSADSPGGTDGLTVTSFLLSWIEFPGSACKSPAGHAMDYPMGHSWSGLVAAAWAAAHPESVDRLVVIDGYPDDWGACRRHQGAGRSDRRAPRVHRVVGRPAPLVQALRHAGTPPTSAARVLSPRNKRASGRCRWRRRWSRGRRSGRPPVGTDQLRGRIDLDHGQAASLRGQCITGAGVGLFPDPKRLYLVLPGLRSTIGGVAVMSSPALRVR